MLPSSASLASVNGRLQTNYNNNGIFKQMALGKMIAVQFVCKHGREDALNKTKNGRSNGRMYSTVKIKYKLIIVKATKLLAKTGIFILLYAFAHSGARKTQNSIQGSWLSVHAVYTEHSARVAMNGVDRQKKKNLIFHDLDKKNIKFPDFQCLE